MGGLLVLSTIGFAQEQAPLVSELLEEGVYQEEANGDLDAAILLYQQIVESEQVSRPKAAEAQYRLAVCYQKQGKQDLSVQAFEALIQNYPNQTEWVDAALELLPKPFAPVTAPWVDGETSTFEIRLPTGAVVGFSFYLAERINQDGRDLWRITNRTLASMEVVNTVEIDPETYQPVYGYFFGGSSEMGEISWWFDPDKVRSVYGDDSEEKVTPIEDSVVDNLQAQYLVRQFPVEVGFTTELHIFVGMTGNLLPVSFTNQEIEVVDTPLGSFECIRTEIDLGPQKQSIWTTTDAARRLIKFQAGGVEIVATRSEVVASDETRTYRDEPLGVSFELPATWAAFSHPGTRKDNDSARFEIRDAGGTASFSLVARRDSEDTDTAERTVLEATRADAEKQMEAYRERIEGFEVDEGSWQELELAGGTGVSVIGGYAGERGPKMAKKILLRTGDLAFVGTLRCSADDFYGYEASLDRIMGSIRID